VLYRLLYTLMMYLVTPIILWRLTARGIRYPEYFGRWRERFGFFPKPGFHGSIWIHAVSVGEVNAAVPLIEALMRRYVGKPFVITTVTPTGSERVQRLFGDRVFHVYLPYDLPASVQRFLDRVQPELALVMETEIWPNLFIACRERGIPIIVANARLSQRSLDGYGPVRPLARRAILAATHVAAQSRQDAERLLKLGADPARLSVAGNVKFDVPIPKGLEQGATLLRDYWGARRPVWVAASTHEAEELPVIEAHTRVLTRFPDALLLIAPRHPERFRAAAQLCRSYGFRTAVRSEDSVANQDTQCFVIDTLGELMTFYAACDVAFVAGSLDTIGGHNVLEPAALGKPVLVGPHTFNFAEISAEMLAHGAAQRIHDSNELGEAVVRLLTQVAERERMGAAALAVVQRERGTVERVMQIVERVMSEPGLAAGGAEPAADPSQDRPR
jgi:3-deoxy-D-manno-octulosonic-acid transferase